MPADVIFIFVVVYLAMMLGRIPGLALDRTGVALLGAIGLLVVGRVGLAEAWEAVDVPTIALLLGLMVVSAELRFGGFYSWLTRRLAAASVSPQGLLALVVAAAGLLSAVLANDIVCLAMAPVLIDGCVRRSLDPVPFLLGLSCAANVGSAATLIGNPQNMLIGQTLGLSFGAYLIQASAPSLLGLVVVWGVIVALHRRSWRRETEIRRIDAPPFDAWHSGKALAAVALIVIAFLATSWPREIVALAGAGVLMTSRRIQSREILGLVDWQLLVLFVALFIVNHALETSGLASHAIEALVARGLDPARPEVLFTGTAILSNLVSNVPATMLLLPAARHPMAGPVLALSSTLAGNLIVVGSIANIIVVDQAQRMGVRITWLRHARVGVPVTLITLGLAALWLWWLA